MYTCIYLYLSSMVLQMRIYYNKSVVDVPTCMYLFKSQTDKTNLVFIKTTTMEMKT